MLAANAVPPVEHLGTQLAKNGKEPLSSPGANGLDIDTDTKVWRIHFPRDLWEQAHKHGMIGVGWPPDHPNISLKRFKSIQTGDRLVVYVQGGTIGSVGVVTRPWYDAQKQDSERISLFGGGYLQRVDVAWTEALVEPVNLLSVLDEPQHTSLRNRLRNPHTVIPLTHQDYGTILGLLGIQDPGTSESETRLPHLWPSLAYARDFAMKLDSRSYSASELYDLAMDYGIPPIPEWTGTTLPRGCVSSGCCEAQATLATRRTLTWRATRQPYCA